MILTPVHELKILMEKKPGTSVSLYMPTHRSGANTQQDPIRYRNLLRQAEERLIASALRTVDAQRMLEHAHSLIGYSPFWRHLSDGLAMFIAADVFRYYTLPLNFEEQLIVADRFYLKPLLPLLSGDGRFYLLALSQNQVRLLHGSRYSASEVDLEDVPRSMSEILGDVEKERHLQFHTRTSGGPGRRAAVFFGHGAGEDETRQDLLRYFRKIDTELRDLLRDEQAPLVLAGVDYLLPLYKEANSYPYLIEEGITGNPDELNDQELHRRAWEVVQPYFQEAQQETIAHYEQLAGTERTSSEVNEIVPAAYHGRVDRLIVALGVQTWGSFDPQSNLVEMHTHPEQEDEDLLQFAAIHTLLNRGTVFAVQRDQVPNQGLIAAILRY